MNIPLAIYMLIGLLVICRPSVLRSIWTTLFGDEEPSGPFALGMAILFVALAAAIGVIWWPLPVLGFLIGQLAWRAKR